MESYLRLRRAHQLFVDAYIKLGVGTKAMIEAGYRGRWAAYRAHVILKREDVRLAIAERTQEAIAEAGISTVSVLRGIGHRANADRRGIHGPDGKLLPLKDWPEDIAACIEGFEFDLAGNISKVRFSNRNEASRLAAQHLKLLTERHEHTGKDGVPLVPPVINIGFGNGGPGDPKPDTGS